MSAGGGCEAAVTVITRCGWVMLRECGELLYGKRFPLKLKGTVYKLCKASNIVRMRSMVLERKRDGNFINNGKICGESNVWSTAQTEKDGRI